MNPEKEKKGQREEDKKDEEVPEASTSNSESNSTKKGLNAFSEEQLTVLGESYSQNPYPLRAEIERLASVTKLQYLQVQHWFANKRSQSKDPQIIARKRMKQEGNVVSVDQVAMDALEEQELENRKEDGGSSIVATGEVDAGSKEENASKVPEEDGGVLLLGEEASEGVFTEWVCPGFDNAMLCPQEVAMINNAAGGSPQTPLGSPHTPLVSLQTPLGSPKTPPTPPHV